MSMSEIRISVSLSLAIIQLFFVYLMGTQSSKIISSTKMASSGDLQQFIKTAISQDKVVVFSKSYCPYCKMAKDVSYFLTCSLISNYGNLSFFVCNESFLKSCSQIWHHHDDVLSTEQPLVLHKNVSLLTHIFQVFSKVKQPIKVYELDERNDGDSIQDTLAQITGFRTVSI